MEEGISGNNGSLRILPSFLVQKTMTGWRFVGFVLNVQMVMTCPALIASGYLRKAIEVV